MILAPAIMTAESIPKKAAEKCLQSVGLDPDLYRIGHTKAGIYFVTYLCPWRVFLLSTYVYMCVYMNLCTSVYTFINVPFLNVRYSLKFKFFFNSSMV